jgi:chromosome condensin MukBEF complex kleisin-like MukF subunit
MPPTWKTIVDNGNHFFALTSGSLRPLSDTLKCSEPGLCGKLLLRGRCNLTGCPREVSHALIHALDPTQIAAVEKWFNAACKEHKLL